MASTRSRVPTLASRPWPPRPASTASPLRDATSTARLGATCRDPWPAATARPWRSQYPTIRDGDLEVVREILGCFGEASGLAVNYDKSVAILIRCTEQVLLEVAPALGCPLGKFPCKYLGLPLSISKLQKRDVQPLIDKLAWKLSFWKARLLSKEGRAAYVQAVMTSSVIYQLIALDLEPWVLQLIDKLRRGFLWVGQEEARGGSCLVAWHSVCQPKSLGGLGFHNLRWLNASLRARWIWFQRTSTAKPWLGLDLAVFKDALALFNATVLITVGSGAQVLFWTDPWISGLYAEAIAPAVVALVRPSRASTATVQQGLIGNRWTADTGGRLSVDAVIQFLNLWRMVQQVQVVDGSPDQFVWKFSADGAYSTKSTYAACFAARMAQPAARQVWNSFAPSKYKMFRWLAVWGRCWTADRLKRRGLANHWTCPLCKLRDETLDHLLLQCTYTHTVWLRVLRQHGWQQLLPSSAASLTDWWPEAESQSRCKQKRATNSLILLTLRSIWLERNARVFDAISCTATSLANRVIDVWKDWIRARALGRGRTVRGVG
ncbi:hypothetical protein ACQ4PT_009542 [Festuca glaucescens]